uniref:Uncharacterized protein n=1 Tax=Arundo donax TaxID=35708 RepID=A0A0A9B428_ARUDO
MIGSGFMLWLMQRIGHSHISCGNYLSHYCFFVRLQTRSNCSMSIHK